MFFNKFVHIVYAYFWKEKEGAAKGVADETGRLGKEKEGAADGAAIGKEKEGAADGAAVEKEKEGAAEEAAVGRLGKAKTGMGAGATFW